MSDLLTDYLSEAEFAKETGIDERTSARYRKQGLPFMYQGGKVMINLPGAREFMARRTRCNASKRRFVVAE